MKKPMKLAGDILTVLVFGGLILGALYLRPPSTSQPARAAEYSCTTEGEVKLDPSVSQMRAGEYIYQKNYCLHYYNYQLVADPGKADQFAKEWQYRFTPAELDTAPKANAAITKLEKAGKLLGLDPAAEPDPRKIFEMGVRALAGIHIDATDPKKRQEFLNYASSVEQDSPLKSKDEAKAAIRKARDWFKRPFDFVKGEAATLHAAEQREGSVVGVGVPISIRNMEQVKLGKTLQLIVHEPEPGNLADGKLQYGDTIISFDDQTVEGMTIAQANGFLHRHKGAPLVKIKVRRRGISDDLTFDLTFEHTPPYPSLLPELPPDEADIGAPVEVTNLDDVQIAPGFELQAADEPFPGSPLKGLVHKGDMFAAVDGQSLDGLTKVQAGVSKIRGPANTKVTLTIVHPIDATAAGQSSSTSQSRQDVTVTRVVIERPAAYFSTLEPAAQKVLDAKGIKVIRIESFESLPLISQLKTLIARAVLPQAIKAVEGNADKEVAGRADLFRTLLQKLESGEQLNDQDLPVALLASHTYDELGHGGGSIIWLDNNPGGDLRLAEKALQTILSEGKLYTQVARLAGTDKIVQTDFSLDRFAMLSVSLQRGESALPREVQSRLPPLMPEKWKLVLKVNHGCASACELVSGAVQGLHRALLLGDYHKDGRLTTTLGKGVGQRVVHLPGDITLSVTSFAFYPAGHDINGKGLVVDFDPPTANWLDAAVAEIERENAQDETRASAAVEGAQSYYSIFDNLIKRRNDEDLKPWDKQDPYLQH